ncbi:CASP-like protein 5A2 [Artemisia annua]|uniref:CASP-like protein 5A2 n=1 Tax=Artemisia annua TaxID=35608 RepID=A0A2U1PTW5_ARTAN|nr:CASP-like protein 5A2 [Artemisia annua]
MSDSNPQSHNPDPVNPNFMPPPVTNDIVRSKRNTRHSGTDNKQAMKNSGSSYKVSLGVKKSSKKSSGKNKGVVKGMEGVEFGEVNAEDMEAKDDETEVSDGDSEVVMASSTQVLVGSDVVSNCDVKSYGKSHVSTTGDKVDGVEGSGTGNENMIPVNELNVGKNGNSGVYNTSNVMRVPFEDNPVLNPSQVKASSSVSNIDKGGSQNKNDNHWPSLSETIKVGGSNNDAEGRLKNHDTIMADNNVKKNVSFASAFKGLTAYGRASFARVLIEVDADRELVDNVEVCYESLGKSMNLRVEYAWKPPHCTQCKVFGHESKACIKREGSRDEKAEKGKSVEENNVKHNENSVDEGKWQDVRKFANNGAGTSKENGNQSNGYYGNRGAKEDINEVEVGSDEWVQMRKKIDLACDLGMSIAESEKLRWSKDLKKYHEDKCSTKANNKMMEGLKWRISKLHKDISYGHTNIAMNAKLKADELCKEIMKETVNKPAVNNIWSVIQRLVLSAAVYSIWHERNNRRANQTSRDVEVVFNSIVNTVRMKLLGLKLKYTANVHKASIIWNIPLGRKGTGLWLCNFCFDPFIGDSVQLCMFRSPFWVIKQNGIVICIKMVFADDWGKHGWAKNKARLKMIMAVEMQCVFCRVEYVIDRHDQVMIKELRCWMIFFMEITSTLTFAAACASAGITVLISSDLQNCAQNHCTRFETSTAMAFVSWFLVSPSFFLNFWSLASR